MRQRVVGGGELRVLEQAGTDTEIAGRYLLQMVSAAGQSLTFESHLFARIADSRAERFVEVARQTGDGDDRECRRPVMTAQGS